MKDIIIKNKYIIMIVIALVILLVLFLVFKQKSIYFDEEMENNPDALEKIEYSPKEQQENDAIELGYELYEKAINIYSMNPYCGVSFEEIDKDKIVNHDGSKYYETLYNNKKDLINDISNTIENPSITINNTYEENDRLYCKYQAPKKSNTYINQYFLDVISQTDNKIDFQVSSSYIKENHTDICTVDTPLDCLEEDLNTEKTNFVIVKINGVWKVREFHIYH